MPYDPHYPPFPDSDPPRTNDGFSDGSFESLGGYSSPSHSSPLPPNPYGQNTGSSSSYSSPLPPIPHEQNTGSSSSYSSPLPPNPYGQNTGSSSSYSSPLPPIPYGQNTGSSSSYSSPLPPIPYGQNTGSSSSYSSPLPPIPHEQNTGSPNSSSAPAPAPASESASAPASGIGHILTAEEYVPDEAAVKKKKKQRITSFIVTVILFGLGGLLLNFFLGTITFASEDIRTLFMQWYWGIAGFFVLIAIIRLVLFLRNPTHLRHYKTEAQLAASQSRFEYSRRQYEIAHGIQSSSTDESLPASYMLNSRQKRESKPVSFKAAALFCAIGSAVLIAFSIPIIISVVDYVQQEQFINRSITVEAELVQVRSEKHHSHSDYGSSHSYYIYYGIVEYVYGDTLYQRGEFQLPSKAHQGDITVVHIDPDNPGDCRPKPSKGNLIFGVGGYIVPVIFAIVFIIAGIYYMIKAKKREREAGR